LPLIEERAHLEVRINYLKDIKKRKKIKKGGNSED